MADDTSWASSLWDWASSDSGTSTIGTLAGALGGYLLSDDDDDDSSGITMYQTGQSSSRNSSRSNSSAPDYVLPFLKGPDGAYGQAQGIYNANMDQGYQGMTDQQRAMNQRMMMGLDRFGLNNLNQNVNRADTFGQRYAADTSGANMGQAMGSMGQLDPSQALSGILRGDIDTRGLDQLQQAAGNRAAIGYGDMLQDYNQQVAPGIRSEALLSGQYGGSRQGVAEGIANQQMLRNARDLTTANMDIGAKLYGDAYSQANQQRYGAAQGLSNLGMQNAQNNLQYGLQSRLQNAGLEQQGMNMQNAALQQYLGAMGAQYDIAGRPVEDARNAQQFGWNQINQYLSGLHGATPQSSSSSSGSSSSQSWTPVKSDDGTSNTAQNIAYGASIGNGLASYLNS